MMDDHPDPVLPAVCSTSRRCPGHGGPRLVLVVTGIATKNRDLNAINEIRLIIQQQKNIHTYIHTYTYIYICIYTYICRDLKQT